MSEQKASRSGRSGCLFEGGKGMLTEQRYEIILGLLREKKNSVTVTELKDILMHRNLRSAETSRRFTRRGS